MGNGKTELGGERMTSQEMLRLYPGPILFTFYFQVVNWDLVTVTDLRCGEYPLSGVNRGKHNCWLHPPRWSMRAHRSRGGFIRCLPGSKVKMQSGN